MPGPLSNILVVAIEQAVAAPVCTVRLADAGARVIKIEREAGETARHYDSAVKGTSAYFAWLNRGKESCVLDLKDEADLALAHRMAARADVFVQNLAPGAAARLGLGSKELTRRHPRLIALDIVGYGQETPYRQMRAYDMLVQAESGICAVTGTEETPSKVGVSVADIATGMSAHAAILEALIERAGTGRGRAIEIAMFDVMADFMSVPLLHLDYGGRDTPRMGLSHASIYPYGSFACADGAVIAVVQNPGEWRRFCEGVLKRPDLAGDPRFADNPSRVRNRPELDAIIGPVFAAETRAEMIARLEASGLAWGKASSLTELSRHPALRRMEVAIPGGSFMSVASPLRPEMEPAGVPSLGADTDKVRREFAA
ncbi:CaiB/BaiF CoA-transferase family protein [Afifella sp. IM 167]|uniref:CaiB/BaiF CoA transferase family protein n=1 Tax=Afifella sp. IM 167 TaxID=2033586 RepID=UPI001CCB4056|nr:CaiB/BaiF CoA-transferase family protein [Afifella sp. IM 167]